MTDSRTMIYLTFTAYLQVPIHLGPTFSFYKPEITFVTLESVFERLVQGLLCIGLAEKNSFPVSPSLPLPLDFLTREQPNLVCLGPSGEVLLHPCAPTVQQGHNLWTNLLLRFFSLKIIDNLII